MVLFTIGKIAIGVQIILLLVWTYSLFIRPNGTDPAGEGTAIVLLLGFAGYIAIGVLMLLTKRFWPMVLMLMMATVPVIIITSMLLQEWSNKGDKG